MFVMAALSALVILFIALLAVGKLALLPIMVARVAFRVLVVIYLIWENMNLMKYSKNCVVESNNTFVSSTKTTQFNSITVRFSFTWDQTFVSAAGYQAQIHSGLWQMSPAPNEQHAQQKVNLGVVILWAIIVIIWSIVKILKHLVPLSLFWQLVTHGY